ncbi:uncharacterized protein LOC124156450 isoform X1 [Ischnura elegans]|uniref:uncharacterized protein LOC124156450 isoform X1 n=1 Tax=Ischnura elegans TaxID=197161 RepID=UPI001ED89756|nr:uncharacterized protein LOC124156450 isoform X1 [Ischnura elegans]
MSERRYPLAALSKRQRRQHVVNEESALLERDDIVFPNDDHETIDDDHDTIDDDHDTIDDDHDTINDDQDNPHHIHGDDILDESSEVSLSSMDSGSDSDADDDFNFHRSIAQWASEGVSIRKSNELLQILRKHHCFRGLPADTRTLLKTPREVNTRSIAGGTYCHVGIEKSLRNVISQNTSVAESGTIRLQCNVDGLPLAKSSGSQVWPILMSLQDFPTVTPFIVGIFHGNQKPLSCSEYFEEYVREMVRLGREGVVYNGLRLEIKVTGYICDAPARAFVKQIKSHNGYFGCGKCTVQGEYVNGRVIFDEISATVRTDGDFIAKTDEDHHVGNSPLVTIPGIRMVTDFPYEYMHLVCLGVMRKLLAAWIKGSLNVRLEARKVALLNERIKHIARYVPWEFVRKPRSLQELLRWKATEFRLFLLYTGPYILKGILTFSPYKHFLSLHYAIRVLVAENYLDSINYANALLTYFVKKFPELYGRDMMSYNVHGLLHLVRDCEVHGPLDKFSAFKFEDKLGQIKRIVRKPNLPLPQIVRRVHEMAHFPQKRQTVQKVREHKFRHALPFDLEEPHYATYTIGSVKISDKPPNNCVVTIRDEIVLVETIACRGGEVFVVGKSFENVSPFYDSPSLSQNVGICEASDFSNLNVWAMKDVRGKACAIPYAGLDQKFYISELLHCH